MGEATASRLWSLPHFHSSDIHWVPMICHTQCWRSAWHGWLRQSPPLGYTQPREAIEYTSQKEDARADRRRLRHRRSPEQPRHNYNMQTANYWLRGHYQTQWDLQSYGDLFASPDGSTSQHLLGWLTRLGYIAVTNQPRLGQLSKPVCFSWFWRLRNQRSSRSGVWWAN